MQPVVITSPASPAALQPVRARYLVRAPQQRTPASRPESYWPGQFLHAFTLQMAAHGHSVSASMMMGDARYAKEQLAHAGRMEDATLRSLAQELGDFFSVPATGARFSGFAVSGARHDDALA